jgi:uncharacterized protein YcbK (DUF882 family)
MKDSEWKNIKHFKPSEFDSPDLKGSGKKMRKVFIEKLEYARINAGVPFKITSGYRSKAYNKKVGGVKDSAHRKFCACDISVTTSAKRFKIIYGLILAGFKRIGIGKNFIHCDTSKIKSQKVAWIYDK